jgi:hypothetical protein
MRKKEVLIGVLFVFLLIGVNFVVAEIEGETEAIQKAYDCLGSEIGNRTCDQLSLEDQIFSLLSMGKCEEQVLIRASGDKMCWPNGNCDLRLTALATLALEKLNINTNNSEDWMLDQKGVPTNIDWFLEIESDGATTCSISQGLKSYTAQINPDKTVSIGNTECFSPSTSLGGYWFEVQIPCYDKEFEISCDQDFLTTFLFKKPNSPTIYVSNKIHSSLAGGTTLEKISSACFKKGNSCDYKGSLWASMVLDFLNQDISSFIPYLLTEKSENPEFFPDSFLYYLTNGLEFKTDLLLKQINQQYWKVGGNKFYDTALALLPFQTEFIQEKENAKQWLIDIQEESGCWNNKNIRDTAFILYSIWPEPTCIEAGHNCVANVTDCNGAILNYSCSEGFCCDAGGMVPPGGDDGNCEEEGYFCMSRISCSDSGGNILPGLDCFGVAQKCCDTPKDEETCSELGGIICNSEEYCASPGEELSSSDLFPGEKCCIEGICEPYSGEEPEQEYDCEVNSGICEFSQCGEGHYESYEYNCEYGDICCLQEENFSDNEKSYWWIWVLFILIILVTVGILYKDKIQEFILNKTKGKKDGNNGRNFPPRFPPSYPKNPGARPPMPRRIFPSQRKPIRDTKKINPINRQIKRPPIRRPMPQKSPKELSEVLKKLKEMGK